MFGTTRFSRRFSATVLLSGALGLAGAGQARADMMAYDSFTGPAGQPLVGMNDGTGFAGAWHPGSRGPDNSSSYVEQGSSLETGSMPSSGGRVASLANYSLGSGITRDLANAIGAGGTTVYISMLVRADGTLNEGASGGFFGLTLNASTSTPNVSQDLFIGKGTSSSYGIEDVGGNNAHLSSSSAAIGVTDLLVVRADFAASGPDKFTLYVNPTATSMGPAVVKQDSNLGTINSISIYSTGAFSLDEIRIGTTLGDVSPAGETIPNAVPEPASLVMLALGTIGVAAGRLRRRRTPLDRG